MNILILNDFCSVSGGAAAVAIASARGLALRGHRVIFFSVVGNVDSRLGNAGIEVMNIGQYEIRDPKRLRSACLRSWNTVAARSLRRRLAGLDPRETIVHLHGWTKALSSSVVQAAVGRGFKLVCTLHDYATACPRGSFFNLRRMDHCRLKPLSWACIKCNCGSRSYLHKLWRTARQVIQQRIGRIPLGVDALIVVSRFSLTILRPHLPENGLVFEIPNPIGTEQQERGNVGSNHAFLMVGRLTVEKGALLLAHAARECGAPVVFVGDGPCRSDVISTNPSAIVTGWVSREEVQQYLRKARALLFPSLMYETQGLVVPEAAALGVPAIVSDTCAAAKYVRDGTTGVLFKNGDLISLTAALQRLSDDSLVRQLGASAYERYWADPPTIERHVTRIEKVYDSVLRGANVFADSSTMGGDS